MTMLISSNPIRAGISCLSDVSRFFGRVLVLLLCMGAATAQDGSPTEKRVPAPAAQTRMDVLKGDWVRPDGAYTIAIKDIAANGQIEATYYNPNRLPFAEAQASTVGASLRVSFELRAGGYAGSSYELDYDPVSDHFKGTCCQAVARQTYDVYFVRK